MNANTSERTKKRSSRSHASNEDAKSKDSVWIQNLRPNLLMVLAVRSCTGIIYCEQSEQMKEGKKVLGKINDPSLERVRRRLGLFFRDA